MSKSLPASKKLMQNYLSELLTEDVKLAKPVTEKVIQTKTLEKLLENVSVTQKVVAKEMVISERSQARSEAIARAKTKAPVIKTETVLAPEPLEAAITTRKSEKKQLIKGNKDYRKGSFQAMFFKVAGLVIAVPLVELGGIYNAEPTNALMGKPDWFEGVMLYRDDKINVVNTAKWVMPEKCSKDLVESLNYQYVIMLNNSRWGLLAEHLVDTVTLEQDDVKWLDDSKKRPWLAGLVKDRMCALLDVEAFIELLNDGDNIHQS
jgi:purine-binding chemotaxis protein CheW